MTWPIINREVGPLRILGFGPLYNKSGEVEAEARLTQKTHWPKYVVVLPVHWRGLGCPLHGGCSILNPNTVRATALIGEHGFISFAAKLRCNARIDNSINLLCARALSCIRILPTSQSEEINTLPRSFHSSSEDDNFSELGSPVPKFVRNPPKLMTEKPEPYRKTNRTGKPSGMPSKSSTRLKYDSSKPESSRRANLAGEVIGKTFDLQFHPLDKQEAVTIRITSINSETTDSEIHSMCICYGTLEGLVRTKEDAVDALFSVKNNLEAQSIIRKLNNTIVNDHTWSANLRPKDTAPAVMSKQTDVDCDLGLHLSHHLADLRRQITVKTLCAEDLEYLHNALFHLVAHPDTSSSISNENR